ncbi:MAG: methylisocitrate lyase [Deltaproteobacteria bacterium RIFCSPLOWO2_12_FULL_44_12]|nr:MAG: methylisocitrate lyase [Deltaproteobacteria bacterium RIFCSPHIGHO2_01_FULL_43_49]OGQ15138.1 MAG: methylisocitrate lyase [Deltaproteobacteria bacterium RIFCSPHIGHO2_02_FULL_44_53]OGQ27241.1 MAG: methylisocitrate lyase [Deltaproteobacteria bacterium RIFCSPHIGHO2_12_FULL_44_21]OGQ31655.1 MAG: methylisocitrate lyase [Deltaproteobacteria bacterium RIFCSPLOWO2_01_FULL_45_74]OGQ42855.1 MAG: methylisocitrate lyase [Deltaproteobacteria bacterium RIFCSPLOWO2_02_FULL_44_34]OGQ69892.1 MAG: methyli
MSHSQTFWKLLKKKPLVLPGVFNPLVGMQAKQVGFKALYLSGGALSASLGHPDIGLVTLSELASHARAIVSATSLPLLVDADTGFGEIVNVHRTVKVLEKAGAAGLHIEDQVLPKRCGHLEGKELISTKAMCEKIRAACAARKNKDFFIMSRTDARAVEGLKGAVNRAKAYLKAGADGIFPEGLTSIQEFTQFAKAFPKTPLLANMTEFGKTPFIDANQFAKMGYAMVIFPVTALRLAMKSIETGFKMIKNKGTQKDLISKMQTRSELYKMLDYEAYVKLDRKVTYK